MVRALIAAVLGGVAVFLFDPDLGTRRRKGLAKLAGQGRESLEQAGKRSRRAATEAKKASRRGAKTIGQLKRDVSGEPSGPSAGTWVLLGGGILAAGAIGAGIAYAMDPDRGAARREQLRQKALDTRNQLQQQGAQAADAAKQRFSEAREQVPTTPGEFEH